MAAAIDEAELATELVEVDRAPTLVAEHVPGDAALEAVAGALEDAGRDEVLRVRTRDVRRLRRR